ncbi:hypothetical protein MYSTI_04833 [Myxococcus stipitatus DSM 14675]|uniref:Lipoprotein n=1 Tax=Myxococcus stipitatus (strain DSM 14675 / JCM 12634 / Mx s8) TaxID=1278073 RepID=L7UDI5_MYXSD|nr:hypothetical protein [Myxococcus stipitatus]AGC46123.1 hypothetical protein MYSTI_04833 [Myxococcus stipitatus DSM 14675]
MRLLRLLGVGCCLLAAGLVAGCAGTIEEEVEPLAVAERNLDPLLGRDYGGAFGYIDGGVLAPNPATGGASCPAGYSATKVLGTSGVDWAAFICSRPTQSGVEPLYDFGGMWGYVDDKLAVNPITRQGACPKGYTDQRILGKTGTDRELHTCYKPHAAGTAPAYYFGGAWGYVDTREVPNPATGSGSCPAGFTTAKVLGTSGVDYAVFYCISPAPRWDFGGAFGYINGGVLVPNPATGGASCPAGYTTTKILGTSNVDWAAFVCSRPYRFGREPLYDFGGMWGYSEGKLVGNPITQTASCAPGYTDQRILGVYGTDYDMHVCYKPHVAGTTPPYPFAGAWGYVDGQQGSNPVTGGRSCPSGFSKTQVLGTYNADYPVFYCEPVVMKFAPRLRFDGEGHGYPMSAQTYYETVIRASTPSAGMENVDVSTLGTGTLPTYFQEIQCGDQVRIKYWWFYGYQRVCDSFGNGSHHGDWENVVVTLSEDRSSIAAVTFTMHGKDYTRLAARGGFELENGSHPVVYVGKNSHAAFQNQGGSGGSIDNCLPMEEYRNNTTGTRLDSWLKLVRLEVGQESWMEADWHGRFAKWGPNGGNGVDNHPTQKAPTCTMNAASWSADTPTWTRSQCKMGDRDDGTTCHSQCRSGYTDMGLTCTNWDIGSLHTYNQNLYGYDYEIPTTDLGLLRGDPR